MVTLKDLIDEVQQEIQEEETSEKRKKVRHIINQCRSYEMMILNKEKELKKLRERKKKAEDKIAQIAKGDESILDSIDLNKQDQQSD